MAGGGKIYGIPKMEKINSQFPTLKYNLQFIVLVVYWFTLLQIFKKVNIVKLLQVEHDFIHNNIQTIKGNVPAN